MSDALVLLGSQRDLPATRFPHARRLQPRDSTEVRKTFEAVPGGVWLAARARSLRPLSGVVPRSADDRSLLLLEGASAGDHEFLRSMFRTVVDASRVRLLPRDELLEVLGSEARADFLVGGTVAPLVEAVVLYRGDLRPLTVPMAWFVARARGPKPDFGALEVTDFGQTLRLGQYEAATEAILYEYDRDFRRRARHKALHQDDSFGGALRRLRLQKGVGRGDFPGIAAKTIARIERGEVQKPHGETLKIIAATLGVPVEQIESY